MIGVIFGYSVGYGGSYGFFGKCFVFIFFGFVVVKEVVV